MLTLPLLREARHGLIPFELVQGEFQLLTVGM
jgi:hypothetical protein